MKEEKAIMKEEREVLAMLQRTAGEFVELVCRAQNIKLKKWDSVPKFSVCVELPLIENAQLSISRLANIACLYNNYCVTYDSLIFFNEANNEDCGV